MNTKLLFSAGLVLLLGSGLFQPFKPEVPEARADEAAVLIQPGESGPMLAKAEMSAFLADFSPYRWHTFYGGEWTDQGYGIAAAGDGSVYIAGASFTSWLGAGDAEPLHPHSGEDDLIVLKLDSEGAYQWHTFYGSDAYELGNGIAVAGDGSVYITGRSGPSWLGDGDAEPLHPHSGFLDLFVLKLDSEGAYQWHTFYGSDSKWHDRGNGIAVGGDGSVYITGTSDTIWLGDGGAEPLHSISIYDDITVLKLDSEGAYQWHTFYGGELGDYGFDITAARDGSVYIAGTSGASWLGDRDAEPLHPHSGDDLFVLKLDSEGTFQWHTFYGSGAYNGDTGTSIAIAGDGSIYVTGFSNGSWQGESYAEALHPFTPSPVPHYDDLFVLKLDSKGAYQWHTFYGSDAEWYDRGNGIAVGDDGSVYITGVSGASWLGDGGAAPLRPFSIYDDITVLKLDSQGAYQWHTFYGGGWGDYGFDITPAGDGSVYITGSSGSWLGDGDAEPLHPHSGDSDLFVLKLGIFPLVILNSTPNPSDFGQVVTFTATVAPFASLIPTGVVTFTEGLIVLGSGVLDASGVAVFETSALAAGEHTITAKYIGDDHFSGSSSSPLVQVVHPAVTLVSLLSTPNPSYFGQVVIFTATVAPFASLIPTGVMTFTDGLTVLGTGMLNTSGVAVFETSALAAGEYTIIAAYGGDEHFSSSSSSPLVQTVQEIDQTRRTYLPLLSR
jgi:hypothetical protein